MTDISEFTPEWPPNWINASNTEMRSYSGPDSVLVYDEGILRGAVSSSASKFASVFGPIFMVFSVDVEGEVVRFHLMGNPRTGRTTP